MGKPDIAQMSFLREFEEFSKHEHDGNGGDVNSVGQSKNGK